MAINIEQAKELLSNFKNKRDQQKLIESFSGIENIDMFYLTNIVNGIFLSLNFIANNSSRRLDLKRLNLSREFGFTEITPAIYLSMVFKQGGAIQRIFNEYQDIDYQKNLADVGMFDNKSYVLFMSKLANAVNQKFSEKYVDTSSSSSSSSVHFIMKNLNTSSSSSDADVKLMDLNFTIDRNKLISEILPVITDCASLELIANPVYFKGDNSKTNIMYDHETINQLFDEVYMKKNMLLLMQELSQKRPKDILINLTGQQVLIDLINKNAVQVLGNNEVMSILHNETQQVRSSQVLKDILINSAVSQADIHGYNQMHPSEIVALFVIPHVIENLKKELKGLEAGSKIYSPMDRSIVDINQVCSARVFMDIILIALKNSNLSDQDINKSANISMEEIESAIELLNSDQNRVASVTQAVVKLNDPTGINNFDAIGLTNDQVRSLREWCIFNKDISSPLYK